MARKDAMCVVLGETGKLGAPIEGLSAHVTEPVYILPASARSRALISAAGRCTL